MRAGFWQELKIYIVLQDFPIKDDMKRKFPMIAVCIMLFGLYGSAQTNVVKQTAVKANDFGITYTLPRTSITIAVEVSKYQSKAGPFALYAERYLGVNTAVMEDKTWYEMGNISMIEYGVADPEQTFLINFKAGTTAPYVYLTEEGFLCSVNADPEPEALTAKSAVVVAPKANANAVNPAQAMTEEMLLAGSVAKQAEIAAKQIYRIRESRLDILTGEADNLPPDGEAMKVVINQLEQQEKALTQMFIGVTTSDSSMYDFTLTPMDGIEKEILFRFSERLGIVAADDLSGSPVYLSITALDKQLPPIDPKEAAKRDKQKGIVYNVPAKIRIEITAAGKTLLDKEVMASQFGRQEKLATEIFEDRKRPVKIFFYPQTGAIKQIIQ
jgi:hypothetical protein